MKPSVSSYLNHSSIPAPGPFQTLNTLTSSFTQQSCRAEATMHHHLQTVPLAGCCQSTLVSRPGAMQLHPDHYPASMTSMKDGFHSPFSFVLHSSPLLACVLALQGLGLLASSGSPCKSKSNWQ